ncbi:MAG: UPF0149 family protein [Xanthomonadales bacterium]|nr:UPF0149 family protein [Xanthomonadales bacterium]
MNVPTSIHHRDLTRTVEHIRIGVSASDLHGSLVGYLCGGGEPSVTWLGDLQLEAAQPNAEDEAMLAALLSLSRASLDDGEPDFEPLLPDAEQALEQRVPALVEWCRGFLGGLGLAGVAEPKNMSSVAADIVHDFAAVAATRYSADDADNDAQAWMDLHEFVCDGVLLLRAELRTPTQRGQVMPPAP